MNGTAEAFIFTMEDVDGEVILFHGSFVLYRQYAEGDTQRHARCMVQSVLTSTSPSSDYWLHVETTLPISLSLRSLLLPYPSLTSCLFSFPPCKTRNSRRYTPTASR
ncbi:hypothetical protein M378DRAFT_466207 [Amanita muscaria Koide BX008]|uniref:Uncharacterized protein n=1 Tax=Amanita muscaria (strain Koide BX008) TaxID=946122 RepID=A0A0C2W603_AMAMK|nr:hypothetical protein M378DRAFT_466207 [Amanita muscaria Koide BX008]